MDEMVEIDFEEVVHETDRAYLFEIDDEEYWIPKSQIHDLDLEEKTFSIPEWLTRDKGLV